MSGKGKRKDVEPHSPSSGGDSDGKPPPKKLSKREADADSDSDSILVCEISKNRRISVRNWNGKVMVDIREYYVKDGKQVPGKKGISLTMDQWNVLSDHVEEIDKAIADKSS